MLVGGASKRLAFGHFDAQFVDRFIRLPTCCADCLLQIVIYWSLVVFSVVILYLEWLCHDTVYIIVRQLWVPIDAAMRSISVLLFPVYFRFLKPKIFNLSFLRRRKRRCPRGMSRSEGEFAVIETALGGKVYFDVTDRVPRIERPHPDELDGEPRCKCCPPPMSGHRMLIVGNYAFVYGGLYERLGGETFHLSTDLWRLCLLNNKWERIPLQQEVYYLTPVSYSWIMTMKWGILTLGGTGYPFGVVTGNKLCVLTINNQGGKLKYNLTPVSSSGNHPPGGYGGVLVADEDNDCIYFMGGTNGSEYYADVYRGDIVVDKRSGITVDWIWLTHNVPVVEGRYRHEAVLFNDRILIFGGGNAETLFSVANVTYFDLNENYFGVCKTIPDPIHGSPDNRDCFSLVQHGDIVFVMGGRAHPEGRVLFDDIWRLDLKTLQWAKHKRTLSFKTAFHASAVDSDGRIFVFGGHRGSASGTNYVGRTNMVQSYLAEPPSLKNICQRFIAQTYKKGIELPVNACTSTNGFIRGVMKYYGGNFPCDAA